MAPRTRTLITSTPKGTGGRFGETWGGHQANNGYSNCNDHTGPGDCDPLDIYKVSVSGGKLDKGNIGDYWSSWFRDYQMDVFDNFDNFPLQQGFDGEMVDTAYAATVASRTNPSRPYIDVPVALFELKDVIPLIRDYGREYFRGTLVNQAAQVNLLHQFGLAPMIGDLVKSFQFTGQVDRRVQELDRLIGNRGLRRTVQLGSFRKSGTMNRVCQSFGGVFISADFQFESSLDIRGHARWLPEPASRSLLVPDSIRGTAARALAGLTIDPSTVWELVPWSWLVDYVTNLGDVIAANRNLVGATLSGVHIIRHTKTTYTWGEQVSGDIRITPSTVTVERKLRNPSYVTPTAHFPFLNGNQVGILASLSLAGSNRSQGR